jgi:hypothetical protein
MPAERLDRSALIQSRMRKQFMACCEFIRFNYKFLKIDF